jgi:hypothetical protein
MILEEARPADWDEIIREPWHCFASAQFNTLNAEKAERVHYLLFRDSKYRLGLVAGENQGTLVSPFSAPFGGYVPMYDDVKIQSIEEAVDITEQWAVTSGLKKIMLTLPPPIYNERFLSKVLNVLHRRNFNIEATELNFHFDLSGEYKNALWKNARKNLNVSLDSNLAFRQCIRESEKEIAYNIISLNRNVKGRPLRMSLQDVLATNDIIPIDFFVVSTAEKLDIASAVVFQAAPKIALVVYWGDVPDFPHLKAMNFLSFKIFEYYKAKGFLFVDIGTANESNSEPNYGLAEFKESLGCNIQPKVTLVKKIG